MVFGRTTSQFELYRDGSLVASDVFGQPQVNQHTDLTIGGVYIQPRN